MIADEFYKWWSEVGSGLPPTPGCDFEEHAKRICLMAFMRAASICVNSLNTPPLITREEAWKIIDKLMACEIELIIQPIDRADLKYLIDKIYGEYIEPGT